MVRDGLTPQVGKELLYTAHTPVVYAEVQVRDAYRLPTTLSTRRADRRIVFASTRALLVMRVRWAADNRVAWVALVTAVVLKTMRRGDRVAAVNRLAIRKRFESHWQLERVGLGGFRQPFQVNSSAPRGLGGFILAWAGNSDGRHSLCE
jgi:hypothetical protein